jgi:hypothetical protein
VLFQAMMPLTTTSVKTVHRSKDELVPHVSGRVRAAQAEVAALVYYPRVSYVRRSFRAAGARVSRLMGKVNVPRPTTAATSLCFNNFSTLGVCGQELVLHRSLGVHVPAHP